MNATKHDASPVKVLKRSPLDNAIDGRAVGDDALLWRRRYLLRRATILRLAVMVAADLSDSESLNRDPGEAAAIDAEILRTSSAPSDRDAYTGAPNAHSSQKPPK